MTTLPSKERVLLIEDEPMIRMVVADMLDELGYEVVMAGPEVESAIDAARTAQVEIAILDLAIEDGNTFPVAEILRQRGVPFMFMTGLDISKARTQFGQTVVLEKPFGAQALQDALRRAVDRSPAK